MITTISKVLTNPTLVNIAKNTDATVATKTSTNAICRPSFILADKNINNDTKKFAATKEFLYQTTCLGVYLAVIVPIFKRGGFKLAKKNIFKNTEGFENFKNLKEYTSYRNIADIVDINKRNAKLQKLTDKKKVNFNQSLQEELKKDTPEKFSSIKGAINLCNLVGSVVGLSIVAPLVSQSLIHPVLKVLGLEKKS